MKRFDRIGPHALAAIGLSMALSILSGCLRGATYRDGAAGQPEERVGELPAAAHKLHPERTGQEALERTLGAMTRSIFYACDKDARLLADWMVDPETAPLPLVIHDESGQEVPWAEIAAGDERLPRLECHIVTSGARVFFEGLQGKANRRIGDMGAPKPPASQRRAESLPPGTQIPVLDHLRTLPPLAHQVHRIGWAYTQLDNLALTQAHSLRDQLNLSVNPDLIPLLQGAFGSPALWRSADGDLVLQFEAVGVDYFMFISKYHFQMQNGKKVRMPGVPAHSDGIMASVRFFSAADPPALLVRYQLEAGPSASHWTLVATDWSAL